MTRPLTNYYPARKTIQSKDNSKCTDYQRFLECNKQIFNPPPNYGFTPILTPRSNSELTWVYPGSKGFRKYQFVICRTCLYFNTLVCLPTGLGKTFIAATVLYNFYRWFNEGLVFFLAPTKPLVDQQYNSFMEIIIGFEKKYIGQLTGKQSKKERSKLYASAKVFFMTPQTLANDLKSGLVDKTKVTCIVFDEAHRATGNYAYCTVVKELLAVRIGFRVLALSATPGSKIESVQEIITNLCISRIEARCENDTDVIPYTHAKNIEIIRLQKTSEISRLEELMLKTIAIPQIHLQKLHLVPFTKGNRPLNKMVVLTSQEELKRNCTNFENVYGKGVLSMAYSNFSSLLSLLGGLNMLLTHGIDSLKSFCEKFKESAETKKGRKSIVNTKEYKELMEYLEDSNNDNMNHPKLEKMKKLLSTFFKEEKHKNSQAIIFTLFVNSAQEICKYLEEDEVISPKVFIGQANGFTQKDQMRIINNFKAHSFNTLVATCIGEEGLDIGYVDLIISYDCTGSPIRMIQRFGRTGRRQEGKVVLLLCDDEEKKYNKMQKVSKEIYGILKRSSDVNNQRVFSFYSLNPRMIRDEVKPVCVYAMCNDDFNDKASPPKAKSDNTQMLKLESTSKETIVEESKEESISEILEEAIDLQELNKEDVLCSDSLTDDLLSLATELIPEHNQEPNNKRLKLYA